MAGDSFGFASFCNHLKLWDDGNGLEVHGKGPEHFRRGEIVVDKKRQASSRNDDEYHSKTKLEILEWKKNSGLGS